MSPIAFFLFDGMQKWLENTNGFLIQWESHILTVFDNPGNYFEYYIDIDI